MKTMFSRLGFLALAVALLAAPAVRAQTGNPPEQPSNPPQQPNATPEANEPRGGDREGLRDLDLSEDQKKQIQAIHQNEKQQLEAVRNDPSLTPAQKREKAREIRRNSNKQISGLLTPEQRRKWKQIRRQRRHHRRQAFRSRRLS